MNADPHPDVRAYLARIGLATATLSPTYATLSAILHAHARSIPFENLDVLLHRPIRLDIAALQRKLVDSRRGGYCFEHATLLAAMLEAIGFAIVRHTARVVLYTSRTQAPRTHMFLTVDVDGRTFVVDPGFGGLAPDAPVPLEAADTDPAGASHWLARDGRSWVLRARAGDSSVDCWVSTLDADNLVDFDVCNHYTATHPASPFVNRLMLRAVTDDGTVSVMNTIVKYTGGDGIRETMLVDRAALRALLSARFGFDLPEVLSMRVPAIGEWT